MSEAAKRIINDWLERVDAGLIEPEDLGFDISVVEALREEAA